MQEPDSYSYRPEGQLAPGTAAPSPGDAYRFSEDELRVLSECNSESFYQRCLPLGTAFGLGTYFAVQSGFLKGNPRFGAAPKMTLAVVIGYFMGKLSYQQACAEKLMALPNSYVGQLLRDKKEGRKEGQVPVPLPTQPGAFLGITSKDIYSDAGPGSSLVLDIDRPVFSEDLFRTGDPVTPASDTAPPSPNVSYDDLRLQNRNQYNDIKQDPYRMDPNLVPPIARNPKPSAPSSYKPATNKYGDPLE